MVFLSLRVNSSICTFLETSLGFISYHLLQIFTHASLTQELWRSCYFEGIDLFGFDFTISKTIVCISFLCYQDFLACRVILESSNLKSKVSFFIQFPSIHTGFLFEGIDMSYIDFEKVNYCLQLFLFMSGLETLKSNGLSLLNSKLVIKFYGVSLSSSGIFHFYAMFLILDLSFLRHFLTMSFPFPNVRFFFED
jgi:hypothetical protein